MFRFASWCSLLAILIAVPSIARADDAPKTAQEKKSDPEEKKSDPQETEKEKKDEDRLVYVSFSPLHLLFPMVEVQGELRIGSRFGVAAIAGYGSMKTQSTALTQATRFTVWEVGGQLVGYPVGHFDHGMQLGVEVLYVGVSTDNVGSSSIAGSAGGLAIGPVAGYKLATKVGFSFNVQLGAEYVTARAEAKSTNGASASERASAIVPVLNANIGWSF